MDVLLVVVAELLALLVITALFAALAVTAAIATALITALAGLRLPGQPILRRFRLLLVAAVTAATVSLVLLHTLALRPALTALFDRVAASHGYRVGLDGASLNPVAHGLELRGLTIRRDPGLTLTIQHLTLDLDWASLLSDRILVRDLTITGVTGLFNAEKRDAVTTERRALPRNFAFNRLFLADVDLALASDTLPLGHHLRITSFEVAPLRGDHPLYDLLLSSRGEISVDALRLIIDGDPGSTRWRIHGIPTAAIHHRLPPPLEWLDQGLLDLELTITTEATPPLTDDPLARGDAELALHLRLHDPRLTPPPELPLRQRLAIKAFERVARIRSPWELKLQIPLRAHDFTGIRSFAESNLAGTFARALEGALVVPLRD